MLKTRPKKLELHWAARPYRTATAFLGTKIRYVERSHTYEIIRFTEGLGDYLVYRHGVRIAIKKSLSGAKRVAERHAKQNGLLV